MNLFHFFLLNKRIKNSIEMSPEFKEELLKENRDIDLLENEILDSPKPVISPEQ